VNLREIANGLMYILNTGCRNPTGAFLPPRLSAPALSGAFFFLRGKTQRLMHIKARRTARTILCLGFTEGGSPRRWRSGLDGNGKTWAAIQ
jgi:hypothetical protein